MLSQALTTWPHSYQNAADKDGTRPEKSEYCGAWATESPPHSWESWPFFLKNRLPEKMGGLLHGASSTMEIAIGISLILIGVLGIRESREWEEDEVQTNFKSLSAAAAPASMELDNGAVSAQSKRAVVFNGLLHGFSWDGAPSLAPALTVATWRGSLTFLFSYALGTMAAMALATVAIGEGTRKAGEIMHRPDIPQKVSFVSSWVAIAVGLFWCKLAVF